MKKSIIIPALIFLANVVLGQKMMTRTGEIKFEATMPGALDDIVATNNIVSCILDQTTGDFVALALVKAFKFKAPLMEEHFNENYIESSKFPKATFKGKIANLDASKLNASKTSYDLEGDLTMHGVTNKIKTKIALSLNSGKVNANANLSVKIKDYKIDIPRIVKNKITENVNMKINFVLEPK
ncbi:MAG: YceI family protein [Flavobacterium sp.]|nr:YceI family protein [Flavobacterium sp.]